MQPLNVGLIGCGNISNGHVRNLLGIEKVSIGGLAEPNADHLARLRGNHARLSEVPDFPTAAALLDSVALDAVVIMTPHAMHYDQVVLAIDSGLHVLCEKPLAVLPDEARDIAARAEAADVVVTVNYQRRLDPAYTRLRRAIEAGELGELQTISMVWGQNWSALTKGMWRQVPALSGGGMLFDSGSHMLDVLLWLAGSRPLSVSALIDNRGTPVDSNCAAIMRFPEQLVAQIMSHGDIPLTWLETTIVSGDKGLMRWEYEPQYPWRSGRLYWYHGGEVVQPVLSGSATSMDEVWVQAIRGQAPNPAPPSVSVGVADLTAALYRSAAEGAAVELAG